MSRKTKLRGTSIPETGRKNYHLLYAVSCTWPPQPYHTGLKLQETVKIINMFKTVTIVLCDKLQRHNVMLRKLIAENLLRQELTAAKKKIIEEETMKEAIRAGKNWQIENSGILAKITIPIRYLHWEAILQSNEFLKMDLSVKDYLLIKPDYRAALALSAAPYLKRFSLDTIEIEKAKCYIHDYLNEEVAAVLSWSLPENKLLDFGNDSYILLYPTKLNAAMYIAGEFNDMPKILPNIWLVFPRKWPEHTLHTRAISTCSTF